MKKPKRSFRRSLGLGVAVIFGILFYTYGFQVTDISLEETRNPQRQASLTRVLRALAHPAIFEYEREEFIVSHPIWIDCPADDLDIAAPVSDMPYIIITPPCAAPEDQVTVEGFGFEPATRGPINLLPPSGVILQLGNAEVDGQGHFVSIVELPNRRALDEPQDVQVVTRRNVGSPMFTYTAYETWDKILETVFMALLATTLGTVLAVPISFLAARNIMREVTGPLASVALSLIGWPLGNFICLQLNTRLFEISRMLTDSLAVNVTAAIIAPAIAWVVGRWALREPASPSSSVARNIKRLLLIIAIGLGLLTLLLIANIAFTQGENLADMLGDFGFIGTFLSDLGEITNIVVGATAVLGLGVFLGGLGNQLGNLILRTVAPVMSRNLPTFPWLSLLDRQFLPSLVQ